MNPIKQLSKLTERQREVLRLFCDGLDYKSIGEKLFIAVPTVKTHMGNIYIKLDLDHLPPAERRVKLIEKYCPLLRKAELPPAPPDATEVPEPVPEPVMKIVEEDERALVPWERPRPPMVIEPQPREIIEYLPKPLPQPRRLRWLLTGMVLSALLIVAIFYKLGGFPRTGDPPVVVVTAIPSVQDTGAPLSGIGTVEAGITPAPSQPTLISVVQTRVVTPKVEITVEEVTATPHDTPKPASPPPTLLPTPTVSKDTPPESILAEGDSWRQNDVRLKLEETNFNTSKECMSLEFDLINDTDHELIVIVTEESFSVEDNLGRRWRLAMLSGGSHYCREGWIDDLSDAVAVGDHFGSWRVAFIGFVTDTSVDEVIVTVDGLSQISNARWRIPIYH